MKLEQHTLRTKDGHAIALTLYQPTEAAGCQLLLLGPGAGVDQSFYRHLAQYGVDKGFSVLTFDYRGTGQSRTGRLAGYKATLRQWANQDLDAVLRYAHNRFPQKELVFLGHGISGEIAGIAAASDYIHRMVLVSSALSCWRLWPRSSQFRIGMMKVLMPMANAWFGYYPGTRFHFFGDMPAGVVREFGSWCNYPNGLFDVFPDHNYRKLQIPILALTFSDDWLTPQKAVTALLHHFSAAQIQWLQLDPTEMGLEPVGHDGFFEPRNQALWDRVLDWIRQ